MKINDNRYYTAFIVIILVVITILLFGCSKKYCQNRYPCAKKDSTSFIESVKIDTFYIPIKSDTTYIQTPIDCPDQTIIYREGKKETQIIIKDKIIRLTAITKEDSARLFLAYKNTKEFKQLTRTITVVEIQTKTPKWAWYCLGIAITLLAWSTRNIWRKLIKFSI